MNEVGAQLLNAETLEYVRGLSSRGIAPTFLLMAVLKQEADCADHRDRIFAVWNIAKECRHLLLEVDYSEPVLDIYTEFTKAYAVHSKSIDIICASQIPLARLGLPDDPLTQDPPDSGLLGFDVPAWAPGWSQNRGVGCLVRRLAFVSQDVGNTRYLDDIEYAPYHADRSLKPSSSARHAPELSLTDSGLIYVACCSRNPGWLYFAFGFARAASWAFDIIRD